MPLLNSRSPELFLDENDYKHLKKILLDATGIELGENKKTLMESRLLKRIGQLDLQGFEDYVIYLERNPDEKHQFINSLTTNKTDWFRESGHFDYLSCKIVPEFQKKNHRPILLWSAACSTGEEVYTLAMVLNELSSARVQYRILGTDVDTEVLKIAEKACYRDELVRQQIAPPLVSKYFLKSTDLKASLRVHPELVQNVKFRQYNLVSSSFPVSIKFDVIFLRNVLIYFKAPTIEIVIHRLIQYLNPGGYLLIGHSESLNGIQHPLEMVAASTFRKVER